jgi:hypothetical protein
MSELGPKKTMLKFKMPISNANKKNQVLLGNQNVVKAIDHVANTKI